MVLNLISWNIAVSVPEMLSYILNHKHALTDPVYIVYSIMCETNRIKQLLLRKCLRESLFKIDIFTS